MTLPFVRRLSLLTRNEWRLLGAGMAAFCVYFAMYAFRKPIAAATFAHVPGFGALDYKTTLILSQTVGYALSKAIGIRVVSGHGRDGRQRTILALIGLAWLALLALPLLPSRWGPLCLFLNGLPLGMIWGLVVSYLEGRRASELLAAMLTASFILSSGTTKSVGRLLLLLGLPSTWMPAMTGLLFAPLLLIGLAILARTPPPDAADIAARGARMPMNASQRHAYLRQFALPVGMLVTGYMLLTGLRDFRDNFSADLWSQFGYANSPGILAISEIPVTIVVLIALAAIMLVRDNLKALLTIHAAIFAGGILLGVSTVAFQWGMIRPLDWMVLSGSGIYLAYAPFSVVLFDRMIAATRRDGLGQSIGQGNAGFLIYIADAFGYGGSIVLLLLSRFWPGLHHTFLAFYVDSALAASVLLMLASAGSALWFVRRGLELERKL